MRLPPGTQSGAEFRLEGQGVRFKDGTRGDLFVRLMVHIPEAANAVGIREQGAALEQYYGSPVRQNLPAALLEL